MLWAKNLLFVALCLLGAGGVAAGLLRRERIEDPQDFRHNRFQLASASQSKSLSEPLQPANDWSQTLADLNDEFHAHWRDKQLPHASRADDLTIARRLSLGLAGTVPSLEEIRALEAVPPVDRIEWWTSRLLADRRYADYVAERLARAYVGTEDGPLILYRRRRFANWLSDNLAEGTRYDEIVRRLIADTGLWNSDPAVNFVTVTIKGNGNNEPDEIRLAGRTTRAFLGMRIDCLQCHDDKLGTIVLGEKSDPQGGKQTDFHQLAAFFAQARLGLVGVRDDAKQRYDYKYLNAEKEIVVPPKVPYGGDMFRGTGSRREQLANWVTNPKNKPFARATVNRIWALMFGRPLVEPIDDIPLFGNYPPGFELLADDFIAHRYDLRRLIRLIAASEVFQLDGRADFEIENEHERNWAVFPLSRLRPEQVAGGLIQSASLATIDANAHIIARLAKFGQTNDFVKRYGDIGEDEFNDRGGTIPQRLLMMNGNLVKERIDNNIVGNAATRIAALTRDDGKAIEAAYLAVLTRRPTDEEREHFLKRLSDRQRRNRAQAIEDLYWVLVNSTEFSWNH
jgi:hypothetical protein